MTSKETVFIAGCSGGGIGSAFAFSFQHRGCHVFASARDPSKMSQIQNLPKVTLVELDVTDIQTMKAAVELVRKETGGTLDYLISNAGRNHFMPVLDEDIAEAKKVFEVNLWGPMTLMRAFAPLVIKAKGRVVYVTSISGYLNISYMGAVKTNGQTYFGDFTLPGESLYKPIEDMIANRAQGHDGVGRMEVLEYAAAVVDEIVRGDNRGGFGMERMQTL